MRLRLALRNLAADAALHALESPPRPGLLAALRAVATTGAGGDHASTLLATGLFVRDGDAVVLRPDLAPDFAVLAERVHRMARAADAVGELPPERGIERTLAAARILFRERLFFEVHEVLEPPWREAEDELRVFLQGLIQVAVGLHHHEEGNLRGALALLSDGNGKLFASVPEAHGIDVDRLCRGVEAFAVGVRHELAGDPLASPPPLPELRNR